jgi:hypothetical protein
MTATTKTPKILIVHLFSNGDCLYATTVARQARHDFPGCHITWLVGSSCSSMVMNNPDIDALWQVDLPASAEDKEKMFEAVIEEAKKKKQSGEFDDIFITQILGDNYAKYDGSLITSIYRCYGHPVTVDKTPVLVLTDAEISKANTFASFNKIDSFKHVVLFECAPQSGQLDIGDTFINNVCAAIMQNEDTCIILSSAKKIQSTVPNVFDGSTLSIRETVALSHHCTLLLGCSSGITWAVASTAGKKLPTIQLLDKNAYIFNPPSITFAQMGKAVDHIIELFDFTVPLLSDCFSVVMNKGFDTARNSYNQKPVKQFRVYRGITHMFIARKKYALLSNFIKLNIAVHGYNLSMLSMIMKGIVLYPIQSRLNAKKIKQETARMGMMAIKKL